MRRSIVLVFTVLASFYNSILYGQGIPTTEEFHGMLQGCAVGANIEVSADLIGSVTQIYEGDKTPGKASIRSQTEFLKLIPEKDRLKAYELYTSCIRDLIRPSTSDDHIDIPKFANAITNPEDAEALEKFVENNRGKLIQITTEIEDQHSEIDNYVDGHDILLVSGYCDESMLPSECASFYLSIKGKDHVLTYYKGNIRLNGYFVVDEYVEMHQGIVYGLKSIPSEQVLLQTQHSKK